MAQIDTVTSYNGIVGVPYNQGILESSITPPIFYTVQSGALPPGLTVDVNNGDITGTPTVAGTYVFTLLLTDSLAPTPTTDTQTYTLVIEPVLSISPLNPNIVINQSKVFTNNVSGGSWTSSCPGAINSLSGLFTAPSSPTTCTVSYATVGEQEVSTTVNVVPTVTLSPAPSFPASVLFIRAGQVLQFTAVGGSGENEFKSSCGLITQTGLFYAPSVSTECTVSVVDKVTGHTFSVTVVIESGSNICLTTQESCN